MITKPDLIKKVIDEIGPNYFDADEYSEISKSRIGSFGIMTETMGTIFENSVINNAIKSRENLTITASRSTLLKEAAGYPDLVIPDASPSKLSIFLGIPINYLKANYMVDPATIEFTLDADTILTVSGISFLMDYDLRIIGKLINGTWIYSSQYIITKENPLSNITNPYLITTQRLTNGEVYLMTSISVSQLVKSYSYYNIVETEAIPLNGIDFTYSDKLAYFNVFYKAANQQSYTLIDKVNRYSKNIPTNKYVYYDTSKLQYIRIYIPDSLGFEFNSELRIDIYTTLGTKGSFIYTSGAIDVVPKSFNDEYDYTGIYFLPVAMSDSAGGTDTLTTEQIRSKLIYYKSTLRSIDTEPDLNAYFKSLDTINNMNFIKKRIDVLEKLYTGFMLLRDENNNILSSNSLEVLLHENDITATYVQTGRRVISPTKTYSLKTGENFLVIPEDISALTEAQIAALEVNTAKFLFACPYLMVINSSPESISYYLNSIDTDNTMTIEYYNENALVQFVINKINIKRNAINGDSNYTITINIIPSSELPPGIVDVDGNILDATIIKAYGYIYSAEVEDTITHYFPITINSYNVANGYFVATATLTTDDYITLVDELRLTNSLYASGASVTSDAVINIDNIKLGIGIYYKNPLLTDKSTYASIIPGLEAYGLVNVYTNKNDKSTFMIDVSKNIKSVVSVIDNGDTTLSFDIKQVPLIRYTELKSNVNIIADTIQNTNDIITQMLTQIKNNCSIDYKFYATYGKSRYFTVGDTATALDNLNISLIFKIRVSSSKSDVNIASDLKAYIKPLIENVNKLDVINSIYFSNIITQIENEFKYVQNRILSCELIKVNNYDTLYQSIINNTKELPFMTKSELQLYVAEFVKIGIDNITIQLVQI